MHIVLNLAMVLMVLIFSQIARSATGAAVGGELGGNGTLLTSDKSLGAFGMGAGYQGSAFFSLWTERPIGGKVRIESIKMTQVALSPSDTDFIEAGTKLRSMTQSWTLVSAGAEGRFAVHSQQWFWEALLGYAMGGDGTVSVSYNQPDRAARDTTHKNRSFLAVSGGVGLSKNIYPKLIGIMSVRTMFLLGTPYSSDTLQDKSYILVPLMFSVGLAYPFSF